MSDNPEPSAPPECGTHQFDRRKDRLLRLPAVRDRTGLSTATIYRRQGEGTFPRSVRIGSNAVAWYESDIDAFVASPIPSSRSNVEGRR